MKRLELTALQLIAFWEIFTMFTKKKKNRENCLIVAYALSMLDPSNLDLRNAFET